jgi:ATP-dependent Clp protease ATP-binding subunit ClpB
VDADRFRASSDAFVGLDAVTSNIPIRRIDDVVVFHPLGREHMTAIAEIQLDSLRARLKEQELGLELSSAATQRLTEQGYDPVYGARPLKRAIQRSIENPLAAELLSGRFHPGDLIRVDVDGEAFKFERVAAA